MSDTEPIVTPSDQPIENVLAPHQAGGAYPDDTVSADAMSWTTNLIPNVDPNIAGDRFGEPIATYSRARAMADGPLTEVAAQPAHGARFTVPVVVTAAVWADAVAAIDADNRRTHAVQDGQGRLWMCCERPVTRSNMRRTAIGCRYERLG